MNIKRLAAFVVLKRCSVLMLDIIIKLKSCRGAVEIVPLIWEVMGPNLDWYLLIIPSHKKKCISFMCIIIVRLILVLVIGLAFIFLNKHFSWYRVCDRG